LSAAYERLSREYSLAKKKDPASDEILLHRDNVLANILAWGGRRPMADVRIGQPRIAGHQAVVAASAVFKGDDEGKVWADSARKYEFFFVRKGERWLLDNVRVTQDADGKFPLTSPLSELSEKLAKSFLKQTAWWKKRLAGDPHSGRRRPPPSLAREAF
jgi:hypothetical protein